MAKVQTGAKQPLSLTRQQVSEQQAMGQKQREADKMSPQEKKQLNQAAEKEQLREEVANNGRFVAKGDVNVGEKLPLIFGCKRIGRWGMVEGGDTKFSKIAAEVYGNAGMWKFVADANGYAVDEVKKSSPIYVPDITRSTYQLDNGQTYTQYSYGGIQLNTVKPLMQVTGEVNLKSYARVSFVEYVFVGSSYSGEFIGKQTLPWESYHEGHEKAKDYPSPTSGPSPSQGLKPQVTPKPTPIPTVNRGAAGFQERGCVSPDGQVADTILKRSNEIGGLIDGTNVVIKNSDISCRVGSKGYTLFKAVRNMDDFNIPWTSGKAFGRSFVRSGLKGTIIITIIWAGLKAANDYDRNRDVTHAVLKFGVELGKGAASAWSGVAVSAAVFGWVPGVGWAFLLAAGSGVLAGYFVAVALDYGENQILGDW